ncbi:MAG TPA: PAS domain S-box protein [Thermoanaerobaculia bacterium]|nr:PAS domain S-box protein [Thermoanaerobaculia bacterium]
MIHSRQLFLRSVERLLQLAVSICGVRFGIVRIDGEAPVTAGEPVPPEAEEPLARLAASQDTLLDILERSDLERAGVPMIRYYAGVQLLDETGTPHGTFAVFDDRKQSLTKLQEDALLGIAAQVTRDVQMAMRPSIDDLPVALFTYSVDTARFTSVNAKFAATLGYGPAEILALGSVTDIIPEDQREQMREMLRRRQSGDDREVRYTTKVRCRDGTILDAEIHSSIADIDGERVVVGVAVDVTTQTASHGHLREREEYFRALTEHARDAVAIASSDHVLTYVSPSVTRVLGYEPEELLGETCSKMIHADDGQRFTSSVAALQAGASSEPAELRLQHRNGSWRTLEVVATNLLEHPHIRGVALNLHDITERKRMERQLAQLDRLTSLGRLSAQIAHEFNNVLMGIQSVTEAIRRRADGDAALLRFTDVITASLKRGNRLTTDVLRFGQPAQLTLRPVDVRALFRQTADEIRPLLGNRIQLEVVCADPLFVHGDAGQLAQVLINLALNARDAMETAGGTLRLEARPALEGEIAGAERFVHISVRDTGSGISADDLPYIFEPLFTTKNRGTGLGLSVAFQVIAAHGGEITVESKPGEGTTFHLFVPSDAAAEEPEEEPSPLSEEPLPESVRVLIVDDDDSVATGLRWSLEAVGMEADVVGTGAEVLPAIERFRPDVVVLDLSLPDEDGRTVYERIAARSDVPVIFSSGHVSDAELPELLGLARTRFLMKPYPTDALVNAIRELVESRRE